MSSSYEKKSVICKKKKIIYKLPFSIDIIRRIENFLFYDTIPLDDERYTLLLTRPSIICNYDTLSYNPDSFYRRDYQPNLFYFVILKINDDKDYIMDYRDDRLRLSLHKYYSDYCEVLFRDYYLNGNNDNEENYDVIYL